MGKLKDDPITETDLIEFVESESDFAFELLVLNGLNQKGHQCDHGGTYEDSVTKKLRQFDLRAVCKFGHARIHLAIECKQLRDNFPLLMLRTPRRSDESFHELLLTVDQRKWRLSKGMDRSAMNVRMDGSASLYPAGDFVGKSCAQVGRDNTGIIGTDAETFAKWTQAISSAQGLIDQARSNPSPDPEGWITSLVLPVVVVPDGRLWVIDYGADGRRTTEPAKVNRCSYFLSAYYRSGNALYGTDYTISHLEFATVAGLDELIDNLGSKREGPNCRYFSAERYRDYLEKIER